MLLQCSVRRTLKQNKHIIQQWAAPTFTAQMPLRPQMHAARPHADLPKALPMRQEGSNPPRAFQATADLQSDHALASPVQVHVLLSAPLGARVARRPQAA